MSIKQYLRKYLSPIKQKYKEKKEDFNYWRYLATYNKKNVYIIGTPMHTNVGDNAIAFAEILFLQNYGIKAENIKEITVDEYKRYKTVIEKWMKNKIVFMHGGGNMGNQWFGEELFRRDVMMNLQYKHMFIFPQTFFYTDDNQGKLECQKSIEFYNDIDNLTILGREKKSFDLLCQYYPDTKVLLTPDIVFSMDPKNIVPTDKKRDGLLFVMRTDNERLLNDEQMNELESFVKECNMEYRISDMITSLTIDKNDRKTLLVDKMQEFTSSKIVITDRLHAMVFAAISETPCIVLMNNNHKIIETYKWISHLPYVKIANNLSDVKEYVVELSQLSNNSYNYTELSSKFDEFKKLIDLQIRR